MKQNIRSNVVKKSLSAWKKYAPYVIVFALGLAVHAALPSLVAFAHGGSTALIHGCVKNSNGSLRIVGANDNCDNNEAALDWSISGSGGGGGSDSNLVLGGGWIEFDDLFLGYDFSSKHLGEVIFQLGDMTDANFSNSTFYGGSMGSINLTNVDFSNAVFKSYSLSQSDLTGANFSGAHFKSSFFQSVDFSVATTTGVTFEGEHEWIDVTCPDGTNSDDNGETCIGHF
jgi:uncharacterized protein YjbI with pentapeptide repeats